jgi:hypothetical protein
MINSVDSHIAENPIDICQLGFLLLECDDNFASYLDFTFEASSIILATACGCDI